MATASSKKVVLAALFGNTAIAVTKLIAAAITGSSAMLSEGIHSLVDTCNELLLLYGMKRAQRPPDATQPFGYGREVYFWSFIVALLVFALGAGISFYEGITHLQHPTPMERPLINYAVLGISMVFEGISWWVAIKAFRATKGSRGWFETFRASKDASTFTVLFEDTAALCGLSIAFAGVALSHATGNPIYDGYASIGIGVVLAVASFLLARETKGLLLGEAAHPHVRDSILRIADSDEGIRSANGVLTMQLGPNSVLATLSAEFEDDLLIPQVEACVNRIEAAVRREHPDVVALFVKPQTAQVWRQRMARLRDDAPS